MKFGAFSILAHMLLTLPHPLRFGPEQQHQQKPPQQPPSSAPATATSFPSDSPSASHHRPTPSHSVFHRLYRPLTSLSESLTPASRIYRGLTPQYKVFLQIAAMTLGGCLWAEARVNDLRTRTRRERRAILAAAERERMGMVE